MERFEREHRERSKAEEKLLRRSASRTDLSPCPQTFQPYGSAHPH
jgi:hypothetical protein